MESKLFILIVLVLGTVAVAQLARLYNMSAKLRKKGEEEISDRDNMFNARMMLGFMMALYIFFIYLMLEYGWTGRGDAASTIGVETDWLLNINFVIIIMVFFLTNTLLFFFTFRYVRKKGVKAYYFPHNNKLEMIWTIVPACVLAFIIVLGLKKWNEATSESSTDAIRVELYSKQFDWTARYGGRDNQLGKFDYKLTTDKNELGLVTAEAIDSAIVQMQSGPTGIDSLAAKLNDRNQIFGEVDQKKMEKDLSAKTRLIRLLYQMKQHHNKGQDKQAWDDIIQKDTLYLCEDTPYEFTFRAKDVIHSAYFPHFRAQMNTVPGYTTRFKFTPIYTTEEMRAKMNNPKFSYILMCNKICGGAHYKMKMAVVVLSKSEYKAWMASKAKSTFKDTFLAKTEAPAAPSSPDGMAKDSVSDVAIKPDSVVVQAKPM
jgi:cytochrome c oxidase subunit 2